MSTHERFDPHMLLTSPAVSRKSRDDESNSLATKDSDSTVKWVVSEIPPSPCLLADANHECVPGSTGLENLAIPFASVELEPTLVEST